MSPSTEPLVTVLMPVYNAELYVREAVESILEQTYRHFRFLIIDDASTDKTAEILASFDDPRIRLLANKTNQGVVRTLNRGLGLAVGKYIARMDADDISLPYRLEKQVAFMESRPDVGVLSAWIRCTGVRHSPVWKSPENHDDILAAMFSDSCIWHPAAILRRDVLEKHNLIYDEAFPGSEDYRLWLRVSEVARLANLPEVLLHYRIHPEQVSRRANSSRKIRESLLEKFLGKVPAPLELKLHAHLHFEKPFADSETLRDVERWVESLKLLNQQKHIYSEPAFSDHLNRVLHAVKRKSFHYGLRGKKRYSPDVLLRLYLTGDRFYRYFDTPTLLRLTLKSLLFWPTHYKQAESTAEKESSGQSESIRQEGA